MTHSSELSPNGTLQLQRETIRQSINEITEALNSALVQAGVPFPVFLCIPSTGDAIATFASPVEPDDAAWDRITRIVCEIVGKKIGSTALMTRSLACAMAGTQMGSCDLLREPE
jgi:hypothetical protein